MTDKTERTDYPERGLCSNKKFPERTYAAEDLLERTDYPDLEDHSVPTDLEEAALWLAAGIGTVIVSGILVWLGAGVWFYFFGG
jgi:hypothetical protein